METKRIYGEFETLTPLSHIGETISTNTYLVEEPVLQPDGSIKKVFVYNGNAFRGQLRDMAASYMLRKLECTVSLDIFHLLYTGGKIGGEQSIKLDHARTMRDLVPMISLFGGGVGNQIMPGKLRVSGSYPVCEEAKPVLPEYLHDRAQTFSYADMTMEKSYTRMDDSKNPDLQDFIANIEDLFAKENDKKKEVHTQMRMTGELLIPGVFLAHTIDCLDVNDLEMGVLVSAFCEFGKSMYIGGQANRGHGKVRYSSGLTDSSFIKVNDEGLSFGEEAQEAKKNYDEYLDKAARGKEIYEILEAVKCGSQP